MCCEIFFRDVAYNLNVKYLECILLLADKTENNDRGRSVHAQVKKGKGSPYGADPGSWQSACR